MESKRYLYSQVKGSKVQGGFENFLPQEGIVEGNSIVANGRYVAFPLNVGPHSGAL